MNVLDWLRDNRQWVFSGIGVPIVVALFALLFRRKSHQPAVRIIDEPTLMATIATNSSASLSVNPSVPLATNPSIRLAPVPIASLLTPTYILDTVGAAPPLGRDYAAAQFIGVAVEWDFPLSSARNYGESIHVRLRIRSLSTIICNVDPTQNTFLRFTHEGSLIRVRGIISNLDEWDITLKDATLSLLQAAQPKNAGDHFWVLPPRSCAFSSFHRARRSAILDSQP